MCFINEIEGYDGICFFLRMVDSAPNIDIHDLGSTRVENTFFSRMT